jgi:hypothetical protein
VVFAVIACEPAIGKALELIDGLMVNVVAFDVVHERFTVAPAVTLVESALKVTVGAGGGGGVDVLLFPPHAAKISNSARGARTVSKRKGRSNIGIPQKVGC